MTEKQINDIIEELNDIQVGLEMVMSNVQREHSNVEDLIGKFTAMLADAEPDKKYYQFMDDETGELLVVYATDVVTARKILKDEEIENVSFQKIISEEEADIAGFTYWE